MLSCLQLERMTDKAIITENKMFLFIKFYKIKSKTIIANKNASASNEQDKVWYLMCFMRASVFFGGKIRQ